MNEATIGHAYVAGDYLCFTDWSTASNTANMDDFVAMADAAGDLDSDSAKRYA
jgi:hypothetical protein